MRILIPAVDYPPIEGGIGTVALEVSRELAALGHEVTVVAPFFPGMAAFDAAEPAEVVRFRGYGLGWLRLLPLWRAAAPHIATADLVLGVNIAYGGLLGRWAQRRRGTPYVTFAYAYEFLKFEKNPLAVKIFRNVYEHAEMTIAISAFTRQNLERFGVPGSKIRRILPGAPRPRQVSPQTTERVCAQFGIHQDTRLILSVGRFIPRKGQQTLARAMHGVLELVPHARLVMAGRGPCLEACREQAKAMGLEQTIQCPGYVDEETLAALYQRCDVFALPAGEDENGQVEGFGLVFAEAGAYGKPVVGGRSGGVPDAVIHDQTGLLVPPGDTAATASALLRILTSPETARRMGEAGRERVERELNWRIFTQRLLEALGGNIPQKP